MFSRSFCVCSSSWISSWHPWWSATLCAGASWSCCRAWRRRRASHSRTGAWQTWWKFTNISLVDSSYVFLFGQMSFAAHVCSVWSPTLNWGPRGGPVTVTGSAWVREIWRAERWLVEAGSPALRLAETRDEEMPISVWDSLLTRSHVPGLQTWPQPLLCDRHWWPGSSQGQWQQ